VKILHIAASLRSGGAERQLVETLKFLTAQEGITCELVVLSDDIHYRYVEDMDVKIHSVIRSYKKDLSIFYQLYKICKESKPDIIHSWNSMCSVYAVPAAKLLGIKFVNNFLQDVPPDLGIKDKVWLRAKLTFPLSDKIAANSYAGLKAYKLSPAEGVCLHNGFDFARIEGLDSKDSTRKLFGINTPRVVGMVASFSEKKDYSTFVKAAHMVLEKRDDVTFIAVGDGQYFDDIKKQIKPEFNERIRLLGKQQRVLNIVNLFDIGVLATYTEGISNSIMEYMALKKPVIATNCEGNREIVENNQTGFLVDSTNPEQIKEKIFLLLDNNKLAERIGLNGYEKLKNEFSLEVMGRQFLALYRDLIA
jgi:glycosyltransferase involved in cell wall biosynthesis